jgi:hypothetical protein
MPLFVLTISILAFIVRSFFTCVSDIFSFAPSLQSKGCNNMNEKQEIGKQLQIKTGFEVKENAKRKM